MPLPHTLPTFTTHTHLHMHPCTLSTFMLTHKHSPCSLNCPTSCPHTLPNFIPPSHSLHLHTFTHTRTPPLPTHTHMHTTFTPLPQPPLSFTHTEQWRQQLNREGVVEVTVMAMKRCSNSEWVQFTSIQALQNLCNTGLSVCLSVCQPVCLLQILSVCLSLLHNLAMFVRWPGILYVWCNYYVLCACFYVSVLCPALYRHEL